MCFSHGRKLRHKSHHFRVLFAALLRMLKETLAVVEQGVKQGKTLVQLKQEKVLEPWKEWSGD